MTQHIFLPYIFFNAHAKPNGVHDLSKKYNIWLDPKMGHGSCALFQMPCIFVSCTTMLVNTLSPVVSHNKQPFYQNFLDWIYDPVLGAHKKWNIIKFTNKLHPLNTLMGLIMFSILELMTIWYPWYRQVSMVASF